LRTDYILHNAHIVDTPALLVYPSLIKSNIDLALRIAGGPHLLRPHAKTHKMMEVTRMLLEAGITKFKCATIAEAEMLVSAGASDILLAYQPTVVKASRLSKLAEANPLTKFGYLVDNESSASSLFDILTASNLFPWIDINVGMNRTGLPPQKVSALYSYCKEQGRPPAGLHAYDGHIHDTETGTRFEHAAKIFDTVSQIREQLTKTHGLPVTIVMGGTPNFPYYAAKQDVETSPGTFVFWDEGYRIMLPDMQFEIAAVILTRIISIINEKILCLDLGHKSVAAEGPLPRIYFPDYPNARVISQSEEHLVVEVDDTKAFKTGDAWYGIPAHICPTVALYESVAVVERNEVIGNWEVIARNRKIHF